jgi:trigger factor
VNIAVEDVSPTRKVLVVTLAADEVTAEERTLLGEFSRSVRLPGFRPGKAPIEMVRRRYAREISDELQRKVANKAYEQGVKDSKVNVYAVVGMDGPPPSAGQEATVKITVDVQADFTLPEYQGLPIQVTAAVVSDADVEAAIEDLRQQRADYVVVERPAHAGDFVKLNYLGTLDGRPVAEIVTDRPIFGTQNNTWEEAGAAQAPGVRAVIDGVVGLKAGDKKTVTQTFPAEFEVPALAGKSVEYALEILEVREKVAAALNEEFFKTLQVENLEQLRERVRQDLQSRKEQEVRAAGREQVIRALNGATEFALPESAIETETQNVLRDYLERQIRQGVPEAEFEKRKDELYQGARQAATARVKLTFILLKIAEKEGLKVENEDLHQRIMQEAVMARQKPDQIVKRLQEDRTLLAQFQRTILQGKTLDFVVGKAKVSAPVPA